MLGYLYKDQNNYDAALHSFRKSLTLDGGSAPELAFEIGKIYLEQNQNAEALENFSHAIEIALDNPVLVEPQLLSDMYLSRMKCYEQMELLEHAKEDYKKIQLADPNFLQR